MAHCVHQCCRVCGEASPVVCCNLGATNVFLAVQYPPTHSGATAHMCSMMLWFLDLIKSHRHMSFSKHTPRYLSFDQNSCQCYILCNKQQNRCRETFYLSFWLLLYGFSCKTGGMFETDAFEVAYISMKNCRPLKISLYSLKCTSRPSTLANCPQCLHLKLRVTRATALCIILFWSVAILNYTNMLSTVILLLVISAILNGFIPINDHQLLIVLQKGQKVHITSMCFIYTTNRGCVTQMISYLEWKPQRENGQV